MECSLREYFSKGPTIFHSYEIHLTIFTPKLVEKNKEKLQLIPFQKSACCYIFLVFNFRCYNHDSQLGKGRQHEG